MRSMLAATIIKYTDKAAAALMAKLSSNPIGNSRLSKQLFFKVVGLSNNCKSLYNYSSIEASKHQKS